MIDQKKKVIFPKPGVREIQLGDTKILVDPFISDGDQRALIQIYLDELFSSENNGNYSVLNAENSLLVNIIDLCTDIQLVEEIEGKSTALFTTNTLYANMDFVKKVISSIINYDEFKSTLYRTVEMKLEEKRLSLALGSKLESLYNQLISFIDGISDMSPENIESIKAGLKDVESSPIIKELLPLLKNQAGKAE